MAEEKPVSIPDWVKQLREDIKKDVDDIVHNQLTEFYAGRIEPEIQELKQGQQELQIGLKRLEQSVEELKTGQSHIRDDIKGLEAELSATPSRREVEDLKTRVDHLEQTN